MSESTSVEQAPRWLGIETGATHSTILVAGQGHDVADRFELGPANVRLTTSANLTRFFETIRERAGSLFSGIGAGFAGVRNEDDRHRVVALMTAIWPDVPLVVTDDLETAIEASGPWPDKADARVLLLSGTGSCAYGQNVEGRTVKVGGRGHILGDQGSASDIALQALRGIVYQHDVNGRFPALGEAVLQALQLNAPDDLIPWTQGAGKQDIARLAITVFAEASKGDALAGQIVSEASDRLVDMALHCAGHLAAEDAEVVFVLAGSTLLKQPAFSDRVTRHLRRKHRGAHIVRLRQESVWGAIALARRAGGGAVAHTGPSLRKVTSEAVPLAQLASSPTEQRNPDSLHLDTMPLPEAIDLMVRENASACLAVREVAPDLEWLIEAVVSAFKAGRRLYYVGAGTSGRLGVLDASECPPTFRVPPEQVQGIMAGGQMAIWSAVEGAEDNETAGAEAVRFRGVQKGDVVLGIAASGRTPYVWGALHESRQLGAVTALLCFNPSVQVAPHLAPDRILRINTGPEVLTGSTRLKAGTATKVVLNTVTTLAMVHTGKVLGNLMVDLNASNVKLRDRAVRLVQELTKAPAAIAEEALAKEGWRVKDAVHRVNSGARG